MHNGTLLIPKGTKILVIDPAVLATTKTPIIYQDRTICLSNQSVLVQKLHPDSGETDRFSIVVTHKKPDGTQTFDPTEQDIQIPNPETVFLNNEHYHTTKVSLFPTHNSPSMNEINQEDVGSCALLAGVQSILNQPDGAAFIRGMMKRTKDGRVVVRLFHPQIKQPVYISVPGAILHGKNIGNRHEALWVYALENAFVAFGKKSSPLLSIPATDTHDVFPWHNLVFGANAELVYMLLTGGSPDPHLSREVSSTSHPMDLSYLHNLKEALAQGKFIYCAPVGAGPHSKGFYKGHAYTLLTIFSKEENGQQVYYVRLRNPHGEKAWYERFFDDYHSGVFEISAELFLQHFNSISVIEAASRMFHLEQKRVLKLQALAKDGTVRSFRITRETRLDELGALKVVYQGFVTRLLELELVQAEQLFVEDTIEQTKARFFADSLKAEQDMQHCENVVSFLLTFKASAEPLLDETLQRIYDLLKLEWFINHQTPAIEEEIEQLAEKIVSTSGYNFCSRMHIEYLKLKALSADHQNAGQNGHILLDEENQASEEVETPYINCAFYLDYLYVATALISLVCYTILFTMVVSLTAQCLVVVGTFVGFGLALLALESLAEHPERPLVSEELVPAMVLSI